METKLLYMTNMEQTECSTIITNIIQNEEKTILILEQTIFYPQGGGQPFDTGVIKTGNDSLIFKVEEVRFIDGYVHHIGTTENGIPTIGLEVLCQIDPDRRILHSRLHSAGHIIDIALKKLGIEWIAGKGYHFPQGAYVEYKGNLDSSNIEELKTSIEQKCNEIISRNIETRLVFDNEKLQNGKPMRTVYYGDFGIPCGGTHVLSLRDIQNVTIRKIKQEKENIRVSYSL